MIRHPKASVMKIHISRKSRPTHLATKMTTSRLFITKEVKPKTSIPVWLSITVKWKINLNKTHIYRDPEILTFITIKETAIQKTTKITIKTLAATCRGKKARKLLKVECRTLETKMTRRITSRVMRALPNSSETSSRTSKTRSARTAILMSILSAAARFCSRAA